MSSWHENYLSQFKSNFFHPSVCQIVELGQLLTLILRTYILYYMSCKLKKNYLNFENLLIKFCSIRSRGPRRMNCVMDSIPSWAVEPGGVAPTPTEFLLNSIDSAPPAPLFRSNSICVPTFSGPLNPAKERKLILKNKSPRWHEQLQCWCLNFRGRVTVASVKNFQLVASGENAPNGQDYDKVILQFGKVGKDLFTMDYAYPISAFQAFAICLSSFDTKIACE